MKFDPDSDTLTDFSLLPEGFKMHPERLSRADITAITRRMVLGESDIEVGEAFRLTPNQARDVYAQRVRIDVPPPDLSDLECGPVCEHTRGLDRRLTSSEEYHLREQLDPKPQVWPQDRYNDVETKTPLRDETPAP